MQTARFSIRNLCWATLMLAMGLGWWVHNQHYKNLGTDLQAAVDRAEKFRKVLIVAKSELRQVEQDAKFFKNLADTNLLPYSYPRPVYNVDWSVLNEPIPAIATSARQSN